MLNTIIIKDNAVRKRYTGQLRLLTLVLIEDAKILIIVRGVI